MIALLILAAGLVALWSYDSLLGTVVGVVLLVYLVDCTFRPRRDCPWCKGNKRTAKKPGDPAFRLCWICKGQGAFARPGSLIWRRNRYLYRSDPRDERSARMGDMGKM